MADGFGEPTTEEEARRIESFLKNGAAISLEVVKQVEADAAAKADLTNSATLKFDISSDQLATQAAEAADRRVTIDLVIGDVEGPDQFFAYLFLNNPEADAETSTDDPTFAGAFAFFCDRDEGGVFICKVEGDQPLRFTFDVTDLIQKLPQADQAITSTIVLVPQVEKVEGSPAMALDGATVSVLQSVIKR